ncbi:MAG: diadenylate cyclase CdaA [Candidatus Krumholzibacteria bacterium]|jgi:diadenylate cyclase|nr:diadenylate cyclase CdaA [Candidatus Krumholzibacteria bacterium]MDP6668686.1 diadenylate cyclase CdaA [Candidatus Krumholzibacteria bacterium]MDP6796676.1 diadenylate cyclase CdaA [Candidatus Krumholzibacteria bacterium]MDP7021779.1 diadenylate cyclase CdaA [Candidatus Krumholzibacteria bacterium]
MKLVVLILINLLDILIMSFLIYRLFIVVRKTRAEMMLNGFIVIFMAGYIASLIGLDTFSWVIERFLTVWVIAFIVLFQHELRSALAQLGRNRIVARFLKVDSDQGYLQEILRATGDLKRSGLGALIILERETGLRNYAENGVALDARVSAELIETIFTPPSPLHDGAVILRGDQAVAARVILPLSETGRIEKLGTRHRAALGISEVSDALVIVVSEESRKVSLCENGQIQQDLEITELRKLLVQKLISSVEEEEK